MNLITNNEMKANQDKYQVEIQLKLLYKKETKYLNSFLTRNGLSTKDNDAKICFVDENIKIQWQKVQRQHKQRL